VKTTIIVDSFTTRTEIFICRHIKALHADVVSVKMDTIDNEGWDWKPYVACLNRQNRINESLVSHVIRRLKEILFGVPTPSWPKNMDKLWERYIKERQPDVALAEFGPNGICAMDECKKHGIPLVVHFHGYDASSLLRFKSYRKCLPTLFRQSKSVVVVSHKMKKTLKDIGCPSEKLHVIPCGADITEFSISGEVEKQPCSFLTVASFTPVKGSLFTLKAFEACVKQRPETTLTMIGEGMEFSKAKRWAKKIGLSDKVNFLGYQPINIVRDYMAKSNVFLQHSNITSKGHIEGWGISLAEAASSGMPVIATSHGGIPDQVINGRTGFLVEERDWKAMGDKMILLARNPQLRLKMGLAGRQNIKIMGNFAVQIRKLKKVLELSSDLGT